MRRLHNGLGTMLPGMTACRGGRACAPDSIIAMIVRGPKAFPGRIRANDLPYVSRQTVTQPARRLPRDMEQMWDEIPDTLERENRYV